MNDKLVHDILTKVMNLNKQENFRCIVVVDDYSLIVDIYIAATRPLRKTSILGDKDALMRISSDLSQLLHGFIQVN